MTHISVSPWSGWAYTHQFKRHWLKGRVPESHLRNFTGELPRWKVDAIGYLIEAFDAPPDTSEFLTVAQAEQVRVIKEGDIWLFVETMDRVQRARGWLPRCLLRPQPAGVRSRLASVRWLRCSA